MADAAPETPLHKKIVPARGAAQKAAATLKQQTTKRPRASKVHEASDQESDTDAADSDNMSVDGPPRAGAVNGRGTRGRGKGRGRGGAPRRDSEPNVTRKSNKRSLKSRAASSSPRSSKAIILESSDPPVTPQKRTRPSTSNTPAKRAKLGGSRRSKGSSPFASPRLAVSHSSILDKPGAVYIPGDLVWVMLDLNGVLAANLPEQDEGFYWWPAQMIGDNPLDVSARLFGDDGRGRNRCIDIIPDSSFAIRSFRNNGLVRFNATDFTDTCASPELVPLRHQQASRELSSDLHSRWNVACDDALEVEMDDELPEPPSLLLTMMSADRKGKRKEMEREMERERERKKEEEMEQMKKTTPSGRRTKPPAAPLDEEIKVGEDDGELVLARDHKDRADHWPARVIDVSRDKTGKWLYEVAFIDGKRKKMERSRFFASDEAGFATCQLGTWHTDYPPSDTDELDSDDEFRARDKSRSPSPFDSDLGEITNPREFRALPLARQMRYVYPFLCRVIRHEYEPAFERHDDFMKGGKAREQLGQTASMRGDFSENKMKKISALVRKSMLKDERWAERVYDDDDVLDERESHMAHADWSGETKAESVTESTFVRSDLDAALALAELKCAEETTVHSLSSAAPFESPTPQHRDHEEAVARPVDDESAIEVPDKPTPKAIRPSRSVVTELNFSLEPPPSSIITVNQLDNSSDMELDSDDDDMASPTLPAKPNAEVPVVVIIDQAHPPTDPVPLPSSDHSQSLGSQEHAVPPESDAPQLQPPVNKQVTYSRPRPIGCEQYEHLSRSERGLYCADVLLPEAVLQLHLLRAGRRTSTKLLAPNEEKMLYDEGLDLMKTEVHWITQIMQLRQLAVNSLKRSTKRRDKAPVAVVEGGSSTRPRRKA